MNLLHARRASDGAALVVGEQHLAIEPPARSRDSVTVGVRPEDLSIAPKGESTSFEIVVEAVEFSGARFLGAGRLADTRIAFESSQQIAQGERLRLYADTKQLHFFDSASGERLE